MKLIKLVKNDTSPRLNFTLTQDGNPINLTNSIARLKVRKQGESNNIFSRTCTIVSAVNGTCYYDWQSGDLNEVGMLIGEVEITFSNGQVQTCKDLFKFHVRDEL